MVDMPENEMKRNETKRNETKPMQYQKFSNRSIYAKDWILTAAFIVNPGLNTIHFLQRSTLVGWLVGWLVWFYGISTHVDYLMPHPVYTFILNIQVQKQNMELFFKVFFFLVGLVQIVFCWLVNTDTSMCRGP